MSSAKILPETAAILEVLAAQEGPALSEMSAQEMRAVYGELGVHFDLPARADIRTADQTVNGIPLRLYHPPVQGSDAVIVYIHGGGWVIGDLESHHSLCAEIAGQSGMRVVAVDYRLAPEAIFPAAHEDCIAAISGVLENPDFLEGPAKGVAVAGDSAGANLALAAARCFGPDTLCAQLLIYPVGDCSGTDTVSYRDFAEGYLLDKPLMDRFIAEYLPHTDSRTDPRVSPLLDPPREKLPAAVILTAGLDPLRDEGRMLAGQIAATGTEVHFIEAEGLLHGMATMRKVLPSGEIILRRAIGLFADLIRSQNNKTQEPEA